MYTYCQLEPFSPIRRMFGKYFKIFLFKNRSPPLVLIRNMYTCKRGNNLLIQIFHDSVDEQDNEIECPCFIVCCNYMYYSFCRWLSRVFCFVLCCLGVVFWLWFCFVSFFLCVFFNVWFCFVLFFLLIINLKVDTKTQEIVRVLYGFNNMVWIKLGWKPIFSYLY